VFVVMLCSVLMFILRIEPSTLSNGSSATWHYYMRAVAMLVSVLPSIVSDASYEVTHVVNMKTRNVHTHYPLPYYWRRTIFLVYIVIFILMSWKTDAFEKK